MSEWKDISTAPENLKVLVAYKNSLGKWRIVTGCYHTQLPWSDDHDPTESDGEYAPEGWYEESDSSETIYRTSAEPTHWRNLPSTPDASPSPGTATAASEPVGYVRPDVLADLAAMGPPPAYLNVVMVTAPNNFATEPVYASSDQSRVERLETALKAVWLRARNARGAIESNQVVDKDVHGSMNWIMEQIDQALRGDRS